MLAPTDKFERQYYSFNRKFKKLLPKKSFIVGLRLLHMKYLIKGKIVDSEGKPINNIFIQAMDSDQKLFEDYNDDMLESSMTNPDGSFQISFDDSAFADSWIERKPEIYLMLRNASGQIVHRTDTIKFESDDNKSGTINIPMDITLDSLEKKTEQKSTDLYWNNDRILAAFSSLGDTITLNNSDFQRNFRLLLSSINAWLIYTNEVIWKKFTTMDHKFHVLHCNRPTIVINYRGRNENDQ